MAGAKLIELRSPRHGDSQDSGQTKHFSRLHDHDVGSRHATSQAVADTAHRADHTWSPTLGRPYGVAIRQPGPSVPRHWLVLSP